MKYYALTDLEFIVPLGECTGITDAMDKEPSGTLWTFSEEGLFELRSKITKALYADELYPPVEVPIP